MELLRGLAYPLKGLAILRRHPRLWAYAVPPMLLTFVALVASLVVTAAYYDDLAAAVWSPAAREGVTGALVAALAWLLRALSFVLGLSMSLLACMGLSTLFAAPFNDALSEAVEVREGGRTPPPFSLGRLARDLVRTVRMELTKLCVYALVMGPLLVLSWALPGVGQVVYLAFGGLFTSAYLAFDYIDWPASRRGLGIRARLALFRAHPLRMLGFGLGAWACLFVPFLNLAFMPLAVAGGTRLFLDLSSGSDRA